MIQQEKSLWWVGLVIALGLFILYLLLPSRFYIGDGIQTAMEVAADVNGTRFYHPSGMVPYEPGYLDLGGQRRQMFNVRYYLDYPALTTAVLAAQTLGYQGDVINPILFVRALTGAIGIIFCYLSLYRLRGSAVIAALVSLGLGVTATYWTFSTELYQSIAGAALIAAAFYVLVVIAKGARPVRNTHLIGLAVVLALAALFNIMSVLAVPAFAVSVFLLTPGEKWTVGARRIVICGVAFIITMVVIGFLVLVLFPRPFGLANPLTWSDDSGTSQSVLGDLEPVQDLFRAFLGFAKSQVIFPGISVRYAQGLREYWDTTTSLGRVVLVGFYGVVALVMALPAVVFIIRRRKLEAGERWLWMMLPPLFVCYGLFNWFFLPSDVHYWLVPTLFVWIMIGLLIAHVRQTLPRLYRPLLVGSIAGVIVIFSFNLVNQFWPENKNENPRQQVADLLKTETKTSDLFVSDGDVLDFYISYFTRRDVLSLGVVNLRTNDDLQALQTVVSEQINRHNEDQGRVFVYAVNPDHLSGLAALLGTDNADALEQMWALGDIKVYQASLSE